VYRKRWVIQYLGNIFPEGLVVNGLYLLEIVKRKLIIVLFTGSAVLISSSDPTLGVATLFSAKEISGPKLVALFFLQFNSSTKSSMVLFIKPPAIISQATLVLSPSKKGFIP